jgi:hypothetical protein
MVILYVSRMSFYGSIVTCEPPQLLTFCFGAEPDPAFHFDSNPDPHFTVMRIRIRLVKNNADP